MPPVSCHMMSYGNRSQMSSKKKQTWHTCSACNCVLLSKDVQRHNADFCNQDPSVSEVSVIRPKEWMRGFHGTVEHVNEFLPPDAVGWLRASSVLIHPQSLEALRVSARQPVRVTSNGRTLIGVLWPCKEMGAMKIGVVAKDFPKQGLIDLVPVNTVPCTRLPVRISKSSADPIVFREFLEMYLCEALVQPGVSLQVSYYGRSVIVTPETPLDLAVAGLSLAGGDHQPVPVLCMTRTSTVDVFDEDRTIVQKAEDIDFGCIGGMEGPKKTILNNVVLPYRRDGSCCSVLLWGLPGSGKTLLLKSAAAALPAASFYFSSLDELEERGALVTARSVVLVDVPGLDKDHKAFGILVNMLQHKKEILQVAGVVLAVRQAEDLDLGIRVRFPVEEEIDVPNEAERLQILAVLSSCPPNTILEQLAKKTHGFTGGDLQSVVLAARFSAGATLADRLETARRRVRPTGIRHFILEVPDVKWADIGGNDELKLEIQQAVIWPQQHKEAFDRFGIDPPTGILLYGPPGCSKTLIARALANESRMNFLAVKGPELFSKWVGDSEKAIRDLFARARQVAPTIVFFDEIDAVGGSRGSDKSSGVSDRVLAQLLTELDGLEKTAGVVLLAATNRPDQLDSALLRPGRLDRSVYVCLPCAATRRAILILRTKRMTLADDVPLDKLVDVTDGYSGAELVAVCRQAALAAMRESLESETVRWRHFEESLKAVVPRTEKYLLDIYEQFKLGATL